jgi:peptidoglycan hydrolase-like protein with peptidoglycan-binding domain/multidrug efflux pump subunit AcrA (membrane-fusion protein)
MNEIARQTGGTQVDDPGRRPLRVPSGATDDRILAVPQQHLGSLAEKRVRLLYAVLLAVAAAAAGAWLAGTRIQSPADVAARTAPPSPSPILVPVEERVLSADVVARGTVRFGLPQPVSLAPSPLKVGPASITTLPVRNTQLNEGDVVLTASGRPVFVLQGQAPAYRDLVPGISGDDVVQLKQALKRLGFDPESIDGTYDEHTGAAVARWYKAKGWEPFGPTRDQLATVRALERESSDATKTKAAAAAAAATAEVAIEAARATAAYNVKTAAVESAARFAAQRRPKDSQQGGAALTIENERARAQLATSSADADLAAQIAEQALIALDPRQTDTARNAANAKLEVARAARQKALLEGAVAVQTAEREASLVPGRAELARSAERSARLEGERAVRTAIDARHLAALDLSIASERADQATADVAAAKRKLGFQVPIDEVVFIRTLPVRVEELTAAIGAAATGSLLTVTDNQLAVDASLPLDAAPLVKPGMQVAIDEQALGIKATGVVETVASTPGTRGVDGFHIYLGVRVDSTPVRLEGFSVRLTIPIESTKGVVTAVPVSALSLATDGTSRLQVERNGALEYVTVKPGLSASGYVEVSTLDGKLRPGQLVVVGYNNPGGKDMQ